MSSADTEQTAPDETEAAEEEAAPRDEAREALLAELTGLLGDAVVDSHIAPGRELWLRIDTAQWARAAEVLRQAGFTYFCFLSGIDWKPSPFGKSEGGSVAAPGAGEESGDTGAAADAEPEHGYTGGATRFQVFARLHSIKRGIGVILKADVPDDTLAVPSWTPVFAGANWHERETWEMFGIDFPGHPDLRNIYLPTEFEGHPLRKDFPLLSREVKPWPGIVDVEPMPEEEAGDAAAAEGAAEEGDTP